MRRTLPLIASLASVPFLASCGGGGTTATPITVMVTPASATVSPGQTKQFTDVVTGTTNTAVTWQVNGTTGGNSTVGKITAAGLYTAPNSIPNPATVTVTAVSSANSSSSGSAKVTIAQAVTVAVMPTGTAKTPVLVPVFGTQQFSATINGQPSNAVTWQVNGVTGGGPATGAISSSGLYTAPNSVPTMAVTGSSQTAPVTITAIAQANPNSSASSIVQVTTPNQMAQALPVELGSSGGNSTDSVISGTKITCCSGTLGSLVNRGGNFLILSNNHVLAKRDQGKIGDPITQPGLVDNNCQPGTLVAKLTQFAPLKPTSGTTGTAVADAAIAQIVPGAVDTAGKILQLGVVSGGIPGDAPPSATLFTPSLNPPTPVAKSGQSTGLTCSTITSITAKISVQYPANCGGSTSFTDTFSNQVTVGGGSFSAEGDSGSLIVTRASAEPVALLFAGSDTDTVGNPISAALNALQDPNTHAVPSIVGGADHAVAACSLPGPQSAMAASLTLRKAVASAESLQNALAVRDRHAPELMAPPEVQAVGVGASYDNPAEAAILLFVIKGQPRTNLPAQVDGVRTRIIEGDLFPLRGPLSAADSATLEQSAPQPQLINSVPEAEVDRAKVVHAAHADEWMKKAGVQGVGIGSSVDAPGEAALVIFLIRGVPHDPVPPVIDGLRTRVRESSRFRAGYGDAHGQQACSMPAEKKQKTKPALDSRPRPEPR